jgi:gas vesicle protein
MSKSRFIAGAIFGLVAGLLIAPEKGEDLREDIAVGADQVRKRISRITGHAKAELKDLRGLLENEIEGLAEEVRHRILTILDETGDAMHTLKRNTAAQMS